MAQSPMEELFLYADSTQKPFLAPPVLIRFMQIMTDYHPELCPPWGRPFPWGEDAWGMTWGTGVCAQEQPLSHTAQTHTNAGMGYDFHLGHRLSLLPSWFEHLEEASVEVEGGPGSWELRAASRMWPVRNRGTESCQQPCDLRCGSFSSQTFR